MDTKRSTPSGSNKASIVNPFWPGANSASIAVVTPIAVAALAGLIHVYPTLAQANQRAANNYYSERLFKFYRGMNSKGAPLLEVKRGTQTDAVIEFAQTGGYKRVWFVSAHRTDWASELIKELAQRVPIAFEWKARNTRVALFDFAAARAQEK